MDSDLRRSMLAYYDERAPEYEEAYTLGTGTASIRNPAVFKAEIPRLSKVERQRRCLNNGTSFEVYKRYCDRHDIARWADQYGVVPRVEHFGEAFYAVSGAFDG